MAWRLLIAVTILRIVISDSLGGPTPDASVGNAHESEKAGWEYSVSTSTYLALDSQDYCSPTITGDRDWLHLEVRYNYEALKTGSVWFGYNFTTGEKLELGFTPMVGGIFGNSTGFAPGYMITASYGPVEFWTQGEYFIDSGKRSENFFYNWSELSIAPVEWFRVGLVLDRTKTLGDNIDVRRGPLIGFSYKKVDLSTYWLSPGSADQTFVFAVTVSF
jgi:hypothetical protein